MTSIGWYIVAVNAGAAAGVIVAAFPHSAPPEVRFVGL
jgi:hypothetical protein